MNKGTTQNGMRITPFTLLGIRLDYRLFVSCSKCLPTRHLRGMKTLLRTGF
uniref:Uncharacterized protein n=1 Tax=Rhizophora mucronata TaxID=61149 RepID=A0A2P2J2U7_RHIMU